MGQEVQGKQRDADRTRAELIAVATEVFADRGYSGARVDEIARLTRTTKRMIYYYFGGKEQLYLAVLAGAYRGIREAEESVDIAALEPVQAVRRIAEVTFDHHHAHPEFIRLVAVENIHRAEFVRKIDGLRELANPATSVLEHVLQRGWDRGELRRDVDALDVHLVISSFCVFQVANQHTFGYLFGRDLNDPGERVRARRLIGDVVEGWLRPA